MCVFRLLLTDMLVFLTINLWTLVFLSNFLARNWDTFVDWPATCSSLRFSSAETCYCNIATGAINFCRVYRFMFLNYLYVFLIINKFYRNCIELTKLCCQNRRQPFLKNFHTGVSRSVDRIKVGDGPFQSHSNSHWGKWTFLYLLILVFIIFWVILTSLWSGIVFYVLHD